MGVPLLYDGIAIELFFLPWKGDLKAMDGMGWDGMVWETGFWR